MKAGDLLMMNDELKIYRGDDYVISDYITIHQPTLSEICEYGETEYYSMLYQLTSTPQTMKSQLWDIGIDYTKITAFELFYSILYKLFPQEKTAILFGDLDFTKFELLQKEKDKSLFLFQIVERKADDAIAYEEVIIDEYTYTIIMDYLRNTHFIRKDEKIPANETTKMILIEDAREEIERNKNNEHHSMLKNLISSMINSEGFKYNHSEVWNMKINAFMDSVKRISKIKNADLLLQSGYSGFGVNLKEISNKQLDWLGELE